MKLKVVKASDLDYESEVDVKTIEELFNFIKDCDNAVVIEKDCKRITIYDDYLE
ncbi:hypothetical protein P9858_13295 [Niallia circulans]|jgi:hypothetical protein|uniref:hypothetical protein n=1 Tax=Niallia circulans TaxID=1397 RepID=UPI002E21FBBC|nr:hypothetical protein [Niallia circulans]